MSPGGTRLHGLAWLSGGLHLFILAGAAQSERPEVWPWALFAMAAVSFFAWMANYRRYRQIHDLPTSRIASAAQGYVELFGRCEALPGTLLASPLSASTCCWTDTSSADVGSSSTRTSGCRTTARAIAMRWRWPPENSCG